MRKRKTTEKEVLMRLCDLPRRRLGDRGWGGADTLRASADGDFAVPGSAVGIRGEAAEGR